MDCLFESRSSTGGVVFWAPPSPLPPSAQGFGFPPGVHASPRGQVPPWVRTSRPALSALLLDFFLASRCQGQAFRPQVSGHPLYFPHCFHGTGGQGQAFRGPGFRSAFMLLGGQGQGFLHAFRRQGFQVFRGPGTMLSGFFLTSRPAFRLSGDRRPGARASRPDFAYIK